MLLVEPRELVLSAAPPRAGAGRVDLQVADERARAGQLLDQFQGMGVIGRKVVAVRDVQDIDVPVFGWEALALDALHLLKRGGHPRAARLRAAEELLLGDLARLGRVRD